MLDRAASDVNSIGIMVQLDWMLYERMKEHSRFLAENYDEFIALNAMKYATLYLLEGESARTALNAQLNLSSTAIFRAASRFKQFDFAYTLWSPSSVEPSDALNALGEFLNAGRQREAETMTRHRALLQRLMRLVVVRAIARWCIG